MLEAMSSDLTRLEARLKSVLSKRAGVALAIWGEPGVGKTHTAQVLLRQTPCHSSSLPATASLEQLIQKLPQAKRLPIWAERVIEQITKGQAVDSNTAVSVLGVVLSEAAPFVLHLEDLHEASPEQAEMWQTLAQTLVRTKGVGLVVTSRTEPSEPFSAYRLNPLSQEESSALLEAEAGTALPKTALSWIFAQAKGNPLFSLEYFRFLARQGHLWSDGKAWYWRSPPENLMPVSVEALIEQWLGEAKQDPLLEKVLGLRALLPHIDQTTWAKIAEISSEELEAALLQLQAKEILHLGSFVHPLYLEVLCKNLSPLLKQALARQIVQVLGEADPQSAAGFVREAGLEPQTALDLLKHAAQVAKDSGNSVQAGRFLAQATDYLQGNEQGRLAFEAAQLLQSADYPQTIRMCELALRQLPTDIDIIWYTADMYSEQGQPELAHKILEGLPPENRSGSDWVVRMLASPLGDVKSKVELWNAHPEVHNIADPLVVYRVAYSLSAMGEYEQGKAMALQILQREDLAPVRQAQMYSIVASAYYKQQKAQQAVEWNQKALGVLRGIGHQRGIAAVLGNQAHALEDLDRYQEAMLNHQEALQILNQLGNPFDYAVPVLNLGAYQHWFGEYEQAEALLLEATSIFSKAGVTEYLVDCGAVLCNLYLDWNKPHGVFLAKKYAQMGWDVAQALGAGRIFLKALVPLAMAERQGGNPQRALEIAEQGCAIALNLDGALHGPFVERALCLEALGHKDQALEQLEKALEIAKQEGRKSTIHEIGLEIDRINGNVEQALVRLEWFKRHDFANNINLARRSFPALAKYLEGPKAPALPEPTARLEVLGAMRLNGKAVQGGKRQELLGLLLEARLAGRPELKQLDLLDALYPQESEEKAQAALKKLIHSIRSGLGQEIITTASSGYALGAVNSDVEEFMKSGQAGLWRGVFLEGLEPRVETIREALYQTLATMIQPLIEQNPKEAVRLSRILTEAEPYDPDFWRLSLQALRASNNHKSLGRAYQEAKARMLEVGETLPERWSEFLVR